MSQTSVDLLSEIIDLVEGFVFDDALIRQAFANEVASLKQQHGEDGFKKGNYGPAAKLLEEGKVDLDAPVARLEWTLRLPPGVKERLAAVYKMYTASSCAPLLETRPRRRTNAWS